MPLHQDLTGSEVHEPKDITGALSGQLYVADGAGSGSWTSLNAANNVYVHKEIVDISTAGSSWVRPGVAGIITDIGLVIDGAIATADCGISFAINGVAITGGNITIVQAGSAAGQLAAVVPTAANILLDISSIQLITDGASTNPVTATITFIINVA